MIWTREISLAPASRSVDSVLGGRLELPFFASRSTWKLLRSSGRKRNEIALRMQVSIGTLLRFLLCEVSSHPCLPDSAWP